MKKFLSALLSNASILLWILMILFSSTVRHAIMRDRYIAKHGEELAEKGMRID